MNSKKSAKNEINQDTLNLIDLDDTATMEAVVAGLAESLSEAGESMPTESAQEAGERIQLAEELQEAADDDVAEDAAPHFDVEKEIPEEEVTGDTIVAPELHHDQKEISDAISGGEEENAADTPIGEGEMFQGEVSVDTMLLMEYADEIEKAVGVQQDTAEIRAEELQIGEDHTISQDTLNVLDLSDTAALDALEIATAETEASVSEDTESPVSDITDRKAIDAADSTAADGADADTAEFSEIEEEDFVDLDAGDEEGDPAAEEGEQGRGKRASHKDKDRGKAKTGSGRNLPGKVAIIAAAVILLLAVVLVIVGKASAGRKAKEQAEQMAMLGDRIASVGMSGRNGLSALAEARSSVAELPEEEPEEEESGPGEEMLVDVSFTSVEQDIKIKFVEHGTEVLVRDVPFEVLLTDSNDRESSYTDTDTDGIIYEAGLVSGDYTVTIVPVEGYAFSPFDNPVNVRDKIVYEQINVVEEIRTESEVNVAVEDTAANTAAAEAEPAPAPTNNDTVEYVESSKTAVGDSDGYKRIDKDTIPTPSYACVNVDGREVVFLAGSYYAECAAAQETVIVRAPEDTGSQDSVSDNDSGNSSGNDSQGNGTGDNGNGSGENSGDGNNGNGSGDNNGNGNNGNGSGDNNGNGNNGSGSGDNNGSGNNGNGSGDNNGSGSGDNNGSGNNGDSNNNNNNSGDNSGNGNKEPEDLEAKISGADDLTLIVGDTKALSPKAEYDGSKISGGKFTYSCSDTSIAKVDSDGKITAVKAGSVTITISYSNKENDEKHYHGSTTIIVTVKEKENDRDPAKDNETKLADKNGNQVYIKNSNGKYVEAVYADYYTASEFYIQTEIEYTYTGWQTINGNTYYYDKNGNKVTGDQIIQGVGYSFNADGVLKVEQGAVAGIDVSKWNGSIDWNAVKNSGVSFVIIRCGYRGSSTGVLVEDSLFRSNIQGARAAGLKVGVYFFTQAVNEVEAVEEASMCLQLVQGYGLSYPIFIDTEYTTGKHGRADGLDKATRTAVCNAFCATIQNAGYSAGVYASKSWYNDMLNYSALSGYRIWLAQYASQPSFTGRYDMWQYSEKGSVNGIHGNVDMNWSYLGY